MAYASASQGGYGGGPTVILTDASHADVISISDAELLFTGHLERKGPDLVLTGHDGHGHIIPDYFSAEHPAALEAPNGARIAGDLVELLAGSQAPGQYAQDAQAQTSAPTNSIGRIEKVVGDVTVMRNGVAVALHVGDAVYKNDVVQTGADSSAGIGFPDGTALNLVSNTRMALNDYVYDPNGTSNDALFNLVQGGFAFVAGKVAHTGDMKIGTPVATMGIRGTTGYALQQVATVSANAGNVTMSFAVVADPGSDRVGAYVLIDQFGNEVAVDHAGIWTTLSWDGGNRPPTVHREQMTASNFAIEQALVPALVQILNNINNLTPNPQSGPNNPGSSTPPLFELINLQQYLQQNGNTQQTIINIQNGGANTNTQTQLPATFTIVLGASATSVVTWTSPVSGTWETGSNWSDLTTPGAPEYVNIAQPVKVTVEGSESADGLRIGAGAILNLASGATLEVSQGIADFGTLQINSSGSDPKLAINGTVYLLNNGTLALKGPTDENLIIGVAGTDATLVNVNNTITGSGTIGQGDGALTLVNGKNGTIEATPLLASDSGLLIIDTGNRVSNSGTMTAADGGTLQIADDVRNLGLILAQAGSSVVLLKDRIGNHGGVITADGAGSTVDLEKAHVFHGTPETSNGGVIETMNGQSFFLDVSIADGSIIDTQQFSSLDLRGTTTLHGTVTFEGDGRFELHRHATIVGGSQAELDNYGAISGAGNIGGGDPNFLLVNEQSGTINADGRLTLTIDNDSAGSASNRSSNAVINTGIVEATGSGGLAIVNTTISNASDAAHNTGVVEVAAGSQIILDNATILHGFVTIASGGEMQTTSGTANTIDTAEGQDNLATPTLINAGTLLINDDSSLTLASPYAIDNSGTIQLSSTGGGTDLYFNQADAGINGGGHIILSASTANIIAVTQSGDQLTNFDNTISGAGAIGAGGMILVNGGVINADQQSAALTLDPAFLENTGTVEATSDGTLVFRNTTVTNSSATVEAGGSYSFNNAIEDPAAVSITAPSGVNDAGQIVGTYFSGGRSNGFLHDGGNYITLDDPAATGGTSANAINDSGEVVGTYSAGGTQSGFLFSNGTYVTLNDPLGADGTLANGIDNAGQIVGEYLDAHGSTHGFLFSSGAYTTIDDPLDINGTDAKGINDAGEIVGYYLDGSSVAHGFVYNNGTYVTLNDPSAANGTFAEGINNAGQVVGYYLDSSDVAHGFVYSNGKYFNFDDSAAGKVAGEGTFAFAIDNAGRVSGYYVDGGFDVAGFLAKPAQSPTSGSIFSDSGATVDLVGTSVVGGNLTTAAATNTSAAGLIDVTGNAISAIYDATVNNSGALGIEQGSQLDVSGTTFTGGSLSVAGILDSIGTGSIGSEAITVTGTLEATGGTLTIDSGSSIANYNELLATSDGTIALVGLTVTNAGTVQVDAPDAGQIAKMVLEDATISGGTVNIYGSLNSTGTSFITDAAITNTGTINATAGTLTINDPVSFSNAGTIEATNGASLLIDSDTITNTSGTITATGQNSIVELSNSDVHNQYVITADHGGTVEFSNALVESSGIIAAHGEGSTVELADVTIEGGTLATSDPKFVDGGEIEIAQTLAPSESELDGSENAVMANAYVKLDNGANLELLGTIDNTGTIALAAGGADPSLVIEGQVCLQGSGNIVLSGSGDDIVGATWNDSCNVLINYNDISGAGQIGDCSPDLTLVNTSYGIIDADVSGETLTINTGNPLSNAGTLEASNGGTMLIDDYVSNSGNGKALIEGGILDFVSATNVHEITFNNGSMAEYGELVLGDPQNGYSATIHGFAGVDPGLTTSDSIDLAGTWTTDPSLTGAGRNLVVVLTDGHDDAVTFTFTDFSGTLNVGSDGDGGTLITDPPKAGSTGSSVAVGGAGNDAFVFHPGMGAETTTNFNAKADTIGLDHFANIESVQQLASHITTDVQGDAVIALDHHDSITLPGMSANYLQAHLSSLVHLH